MTDSRFALSDDSPHLHQEQEQHDDYAVAYDNNQQQQHSSLPLPSSFAQQYDDDINTTNHHTPNNNNNTDDNVNDVNDDDNKFGEFLDIQMKRKRENDKISKKDKISIWMIGLNTFFISVATILGTGILGLPVKLYRTGFWPFFTTFIICFIMQAMIIIYLTDILQKTEFIMKLQYFNNLKNTNNNNNIENNSIENNSIENNNIENNNLENNNNIENNLEEIEMIEEQVNENQIEDIVNDNNNQINNQINNENNNTIIIEQEEPVFDPDLHIILGDKYISHVISFATLFKGTLLLIMVGLVGFISNLTNLEFVDKFQYIGHPFLIGTVSLGGVMNTLPVIHQTQIKKSHQNDQEDEEYTEE
ncbi:predicted protein [Naegleria gruberi]|uniref:Predicted protein n=1 Tax=Naegleria gruberi TaxID=5762 RepID=D2W4U5_NAEGR|nr:uncharacterized protein NAEGRDRAFT_76431 [Naegleria gruberi]EFC35909.1 predicted protein [Naegleria gruberi]|eukprot:XP_002668653.1 predicted protein [Naegleria gruberi strain NEG-M]